MILDFGLKQTVKVRDYFLIPAEFFELGADSNNL